MQTNPARALVYGLFLATFTLGLGGGVSAAEPTLSDISPRSLQIGATTKLTLRGQQLDGPQRLLIGGLTVEAAASDNAQPKQVEYEVTLPDDAAPGVYPCWFAGANGVSNVIPLTVHHLPSQSFEPQISALPAALQGTVQGGQILTTSFRGTKGQRIVLEIESRRLGSKLRPVIRLFNPKGTQLAWSQGEDRLDGDSRCETVLTEDGEYSVQVHDLLYKGQAPGLFVLKVGDLATADMAFPLGVQRGARRTLQFLSGSLAGRTTDVEISADELRHVIPVVPPGSPLAGRLPRIQLSDFPELTEDEALAGKPAAPLAISGVLAKPAERDQFEVAVMPNAKLRFELFAQRLGSPVDGVLVVRRDNGQELGRNDDQSSTADPLVDVTIPADVERVQVSVHDLTDASGEAHVYRLAISDLAEPRVDLDLDTDRITIPAGGSALVKVTSRRAAYDGTIDVAFDGLPDGVRVTGNQIPGGGDLALVVLSAEAAVPPVVGRVIGSGQQNDATFRQLGLTPDLFRSQDRPWVRQAVAVSSGPAVPIQLVWNSAEQNSLKLGDKLTAQLQVTRAEGATGKVRIRLQTTQPMPRKKVKEGDKEQEVDDTEKALRLESEPLLDAASQDVTATILVPAELADRPWGLVFVAELLSADEKSVVATGYSHVGWASLARPE